MAREFRVSTTISASAETVWAVLMDTERYPEWDPFCVRVEGHIAPGAQLKVFSKLTPGHGFKVTVDELEPNRRMTWTGGAPLGLLVSQLAVGAGARHGAVSRALNARWRTRFPRPCARRADRHA